MSRATQSEQYKNMTKEEQKQDRIKRFYNNQAERYFNLEKSMERLQTKANNLLNQAKLISQEKNEINKEYKKCKKAIKWAKFNPFKFRKEKVTDDELVIRGYTECLHLLDGIVKQNNKDIETQFDLVNRYIYGTQEEYELEYKYKKIVSLKNYNIGLNRLRDSILHKLKTEYQGWNEED